MPSGPDREILTVGGRDVAVSNPLKVLFPQAGYTKLDLARYYLAVAEGALRAAGGRPNVLVRYPNGIDGEFFFSKARAKVAAAYSVRPRPDARVSAPLAWDEIDACEPADFTLSTMPSRVATIGDRHAAMDDHPGSLVSLLELSTRQKAEGLGDAPWPPHYRKQTGEGPRVAPSRRRTPKHPLIEIGRARVKADALAGLERWKSRPRTRARTSKQPTCSSMPCAAGFAPGPASASIFSTSRSNYDPLRNRSTPTTTSQTSGAASAMPTGRTECLRELAKSPDRDSGSPEATKRQTSR